MRAGIALDGCWRAVQRAASRTTVFAIYGANSSTVDVSVRFDASANSTTVAGTPRRIFKSHGLSQYPVGVEVRISGGRTDGQKDGRTNNGIIIINPP